MLLTIYDKAGNKRADVAVNDSSTQSKEVQGDNVLSLSFSYYAFLPLDVNDYTDYLGERYRLTERYTPKQVSEGEWEYNLKLYGIESLIKRFLVLETTDGDTNPLFTLTATPREHVAMVVKAINDGMGHITDWKTGTVEGTELITIDYEGMYCDEALKAIAEKAGGKVECYYRPTKEEAKAVLDQVIRKNTTVLCKASRGMTMEELVEYIKEIRPEG